MGTTRRNVCLLAVTLSAGCLSDPGVDCPGATVRLSLSSIPSAESPLSLDPGRLSAEAITVVETAIGDEHVEHCVSWDAPSGAAGPSNGLSELGGELESHLGIDLASAPDRIETDARFRDGTYRLVLHTESEQ